MINTYRRDSKGKVRNDELDLLKIAARLNIAAAVTSFSALYPLPAASSGEVLALQRAFARFLIDSGKASTGGVLV